MTQTRKDGLPPKQKDEVKILPASKGCSTGLHFQAKRFEKVPFVPIFSCLKHIFGVLRYHRVL